MSSPETRTVRHSGQHIPDLGNGDAREVLTAAVLGIGLMAMTTIWWWFAMR